MLTAFIVFALIAVVVQHWKGDKISRGEFFWTIFKIYLALIACIAIPMGALMLYGTYMGW